MLGSTARCKGLRPWHRLSQPRFVSCDLKAQRAALLRKIYAPFSRLERDPPEYTRLAESGRVWESHFRPGDMTYLGYDALQKKYRANLAAIDELRDILKPHLGQVAKALVTEYALQSVFIENNPLRLQDARAAFAALSHKIFNRVNLASLDAADLIHLDLPTVDKGVTLDSSAMAELKNHIVASQWIAENAGLHPNTPSIDEKQMTELAALTVKGTASEAVYIGSWGGRVPLGGYRRAPISVSSNPLVIFPYHLEVPACVKRFFDWRDMMHADNKVHPLILACHVMVYFAQIHPFPDGNGRNPERMAFIRSINNAANGDPAELVHTVLTSQSNQESNLGWRNQNPQS
ncbi:Translin-associated protein X [Verticillium dahliae VDG2]|nr:Translin-associated protein X [Verticillium dahliae VDG2]